MTKPTPLLENKILGEGNDAPLWQPVDPTVAMRSITVMVPTKADVAENMQRLRADGAAVSTLEDYSNW